VLKRAQQLKGLALPQQRRRLLAYLARRGFRGRDIQDMVAEMLKAGNTDESRSNDLIR